MVICQSFTEHQNMNDLTPQQYYDIIMDMTDQLRPSEQTTRDVVILKITLVR